MPELSHEIDAARARTARLVDVLKAIAHPLRLAIVATLCGGEQYVAELARCLGARQPIVSQQLGILRAAGVVTVTRRGGHGVYRVERAELAPLVRFAERCRSAGSAGVAGVEVRPARPRLPRRRGSGGHARTAA